MRNLLPSRVMHLKMLGVLFHLSSCQGFKLIIKVVITRRGWRRVP